ncbi:MAG: PH domain-containing protein [Bacilli bacterium]|nr:PH domain-containing protein [Bacilli bacterium]
MEDYFKMFEPILGRDEQIVECFKPNKTRYIWVNILKVVVLFALFFAIPTIFLVISVAIGEVEDGDEFTLLLLIPFLAIYAFLVIGSSLYNLLSYKKVVYCYTNKRIIIRSGIIGVDFKTLEYALIGGISVNVGLFDKLFKTNTGTISFASAAAMVANSKGISPYTFSCVTQPYEVYRRIKEVYDNSREGIIH